jgi:hypothetical protein
MGWIELEQQLVEMVLALMEHRHQTWKRKDSQLRYSGRRRQTLKQTDSTRVETEVGSRPLEFGVDSRKNCRNQDLTADYYLPFESRFRPFVRREN